MYNTTNTPIKTDKHKCFDVFVREQVLFLIQKNKTTILVGKIIFGYVSRCINIGYFLFLKLQLDNIETCFSIVFTAHPFTIT